MTRDHLLVIDQGTTSTRAVVYDSRLRPVGQSQLEVLPSYPRSGWVEHDPDAIISSVGSQVTGAMLDAGIKVRPDRGHRPDQSAGNHDRLGTGHRSSDRAGPGLARPPHGRDLRATQVCTRPTSPGRPGWSSIPTSPRPRSPGSSTMFPTLASVPGPASWPREPSTRS